MFYAIRGVIETKPAQINKYLKNTNIPNLT